MRTEITALHDFWYTVAFRWRYPGYMSFDAFHFLAQSSIFVVAIIYANYGFRFTYAPIAPVIANDVIDARVWCININIVMLPMVLCPLPLHFIRIYRNCVDMYGRVTSCIVMRLIVAMNSVIGGQVIAVNHWQVCVDQLAPTVDTCQSLSYTVHAPVPLILLLSCLYTRHITVSSKGTYSRIIFTRLNFVY